MKAARRLASLNILTVTAFASRGAAQEILPFPLAPSGCNVKMTMKEESERRDRHGRTRAFKPAEGQHLHTAYSLDTYVGGAQLTRFDASG
jgi:hypothetical protein